MPLDTQQVVLEHPEPSLSSITSVVGLEDVVGDVANHFFRPSKSRHDYWICYM